MWIAQQWLINLPLELLFIDYVYFSRSIISSYMMTALIQCIDIGGAQ